MNEKERETAQAEILRAGKLDIRDILRIVREKDDYLFELYSQKKVKQLEIEELDKAIAFLELDMRQADVSEARVPSVVAGAKQKTDAYRRAHYEEKGNSVAQGGWKPLSLTENAILKLFKPGKEVLTCEIARAISATDRRIDNYAEWYYVQKYVDILVGDYYIRKVRKGTYVLVETGIKVMGA